MAIKFSQFVLKTLPSELDYIVGYKGTENLQITPDNFLAPYLGAYLPLAGGTMTGSTNHGDNVKSIYGTGGDFEIYHSGSTSYIADVGSGDLKVLFSNDFIIEAINGETCAKFTENGGVDLYYDNSIKFSTYALGAGITGNLYLTSGSKIHFDNGVSNDYYIEKSGTALLFNTGGTYTFNTGNVGIGVAPTTILDIGGMADPVVLIKSDVGGDPQLRFDGSAANRSGLIKFYDNGAAAGGFIDYHHLGDKMNFGAGSVSTVTMTVTDGDVGIGIESPTHALHVDTTAAGATNPSYIVADSGGVFTMAIGTQNSPGVAQEAFVGTLSNTDFKIMANSAFVGRITTDGKLMVGSADVPAAILELTGSGDAIRVESTNTGAAGAQMDLLHFTTSPADDDIHGLINFGGYYTGTTSAYGTQIKSVWSDVSDRDAELQFWTNKAGVLTKALTLNTDQNATFAGNVELGNNQQVQLGSLSGGDLKLYFDATDGIIVNKTGDLKILNQGNDKDIYFQTDDGAGGTRTYLYLDGSQAAAGDACWTIWPDNSRLGIGTDKDLQIHHELGHNYIAGTTGDLYIRNTADDQNIIFQCDDNSGGIAEYFRIDGLNAINQFSKETFMLDNVKLRFGTGGDLNIYHDTSHSWISDQGTGNLNILTSSLNVNNAADTQNMIVATDGGAVSLYTNGAIKFQTSSTGTTTTGQMNLAGLNTAPASASAAGTLGEIRYTADYIYVCTATDTWKRSALSTW